MGAEFERFLLCTVFVTSKFQYIFFMSNCKTLLFMVQDYQIKKLNFGVLLISTFCINTEFSLFIQTQSYNIISLNLDRIWLLDYYFFRQ